MLDKRFRVLTMQSKANENTEQLRLHNYHRGVDETHLYCESMRVVPVTYNNIKN